MQIVTCVKVCATYQLSAVANNLCILYTGVFCTKYEIYHLIIIVIT